MSKGVKRKWLYAVSLTLFCLGAISIFISLHQPHRSPAAIPTSFSWQDLEMKNRTEILSVLKILKQDSNYVIHLGDIATENICEKYKYILVEFTAEDVAVSGNKPKLKLSSRCVKSQNMVSLFVPVVEILSKQPGVVDFHHLSKEDIHVTVEHVLGFWPKRWGISKILFYNDESGPQLTLTKDHLRNSKLSMTWPQ